MSHGLVIFDCDGVLVDSETLSGSVMAQVLGEFGVAMSPAECIARFTGCSMRSLREMVEQDTGRPLAPVFEVRVRALADALFDRELCAVPGVQEVLAGLEGPRCVASSASPPRIRRSLRTAGLDRLFRSEALFSAVMVERGKPAPDLFLYAAAAMGAPPPSCVVVEDSLIGVQAAVAAGMTVLGFVGASHVDAVHPDRLRAAGATEVFEDMRALPSLLGRVRAAG